MSACDCEADNDSLCRIFAERHPSLGTECSAVAFADCRDMYSVGSPGFYSIVLIRAVAILKLFIVGLLYVERMVQSEVLQVLFESPAIATRGVGIGHESVSGKPATQGLSQPHHLCH